MESVIDTDAPLDYVEFQLFPNRDRFEACACSANVIEKIASGLLGQLLLHLPKLKDLFSRGSKASFQIKRPKDLDSSQWFTKATVTRFLHIIGSLDILNTSISVKNEINQLEETKKFHFSLYTKDECGTAPSDASKNELLQAMELRQTALKTELAAAFNHAAGANCSPKHISNVEKLAQHLGDMELRNTLRKFVELSPTEQKVELPIDSSNKLVDKSDEKTKTKQLSGLDTPVKYGVSPAKAAQIERQSSTDSEKSSDISEDEQPTRERSRSLARSASSRRSSSPMRRVQIGRSGSRRATALTIKSLNYFPGRDKTESCRDGYGSEEEKPPRKSNSNALRISVKDAISLFENKQKDHSSDGQKRSTLDANKSVLRRWSAGFGDPEGVSEISSENAEKGIVHGDNKIKEDAKVDEILLSIEERMSKPIDVEPDILEIQQEENTETLTASGEWNRQKEAELNEMLTKMMQSKPGKNRKINPNKIGAQEVVHEKRGGFYDQYTGKRDDKLRGETTEKRAEKDAQFRAMHQVLEQRKAAMPSANTTAVPRSKISLSKPEKLRKGVTPSSNTKKEFPKSAIANKIQSRPAKTQKPIPTGPMGPQPSPTVESPLQKPKPKPVKAQSQTDTRKSTKGITKKNQQLFPEAAKILKTKAQSISEKESSKNVAKPSIFSNVTKKSSVVPLESKPFLRKAAGPVAKTKSSSLPKKKPENLIAIKKNELVSQHIPQVDVPSEDTQLATQNICSENTYCEQVITNCDDSLIKTSDSELKTEAEENLTISPTVWVEESEENTCIPPDDSTCEISSVIYAEQHVSPRVRHSLSQMLLEESAEVNMTEWGNAEIPPSIVYQKEPPKGLKRLLKFARKSKGDQNSTEGEHDVDESKAFGKKKIDTSLKKAGFHGSNHGYQKTLLGEGHGRAFVGPHKSYAQSHLTNLGSQSSTKRLQDHISGAATNTKATRPFFSLSAFKGHSPQAKRDDASLSI